ncbi:hypothetical protein OESDEN_11827 [Oesophagostomum dentatum]|uniref:Uncharacterized protein n=1 Tax=Oesophagostomum dentatum TaxID=61180 RepID=A0A0B1SYU9_OESDE|nr:hypothetical protein OESDEN_11827 [Oesophagostomum dentatum]
MKGMTNFTDAEANALFGIGMNNANKLISTDQSLAEKMGKFDNAYGTTAFGSPERQFLDKEHADCRNCIAKTPAPPAHLTVLQTDHASSSCHINAWLLLNK